MSLEATFKVKWCQQECTRLKLDFSPDVVPTVCACQVMVSAESCLTECNTCFKKIIITIAIHSRKCVLFCFVFFKKDGSPDIIPHHVDLINECPALACCVCGSSGRKLRTWKKDPSHLTVCHLFNWCVPPLPYQSQTMASILVTTQLSCIDNLFDVWWQKKWSIHVFSSKIVWD